MDTPFDHSAPGEDSPVAFEPARTPRPRRDGWTADRQRVFIRALAETGCATYAAATVGLSASSAYRLAAKAEARAFARAWDEALLVAHRRLVGIGMQFVTDGVRETVWKDGVCVGERRRPSERLLVFLLKHLDPRRADPPRRDVEFEFEHGDVPLELPTGELAMLMNRFEDDDEELEELEERGTLPLAADPLLARAQAPPRSHA
jgi:hypothetical protein